MMSSFARSLMIIAEQHRHSWNNTEECLSVCRRRQTVLFLRLDKQCFGRWQRMSDKEAWYSMQLISPSSGNLYIHAQWPREQCALLQKGGFYYKKGVSTTKTRSAGAHASRSHRSSHRRDSPASRTGLVVIRYQVVRQKEEQCNCTYWLVVDAEAS